MPNNGEKPSADQIGIDTPLRLAVAVKIAFPNGALTVSGLKKEIERGRLIVEIIAGKMFVTLRAIEEMRRLCRVQRKGPGSTSAPSEDTETGGSRSDPLGSSETARSSSPQAALRLKLQKLKAS
jgi:hypothetical protein